MKIKSRDCITVMQWSCASVRQKSPSWNIQGLRFAREEKLDWVYLYTNDTSLRVSQTSLLLLHRTTMTGTYSSMIPQKLEGKLVLNDVCKFFTSDPAEMFGLFAQCGLGGILGRLKRRELHSMWCLFASVLLCVPPHLHVCVVHVLSCSF